MASSLAGVGRRFSVMGRCFSSSICLAAQKNRRESESAYKIQSYRGTKRAVLDYSENLLGATAITPRYPYSLVMSALRAYSVLPMSDEEPVCAVVHLDRSKETKSSKDVATTLSLPHGRFGDPLSIGVFADGELADAARNAGAVVISSREMSDYMRELSEEEVERCSAYLATVDLVNQVRAHARILRDLTPTAKKKLVFHMSVDLVQKIDELKYLRSYQLRKDHPVSFAVGSVTHTDDQVRENLTFFLTNIRRQLSEYGAEPKIKKLFLKTGNGCTYRLDDESLDSFLELITSE